MQDPETIIGEITARRFPYDDLPHDLADLLDSHCSHLAALVASLQTAGRNEASIRSLVTVLVSKYEADLLEVLKARNDQAL